MNGLVQLLEAPLAVSVFCIAAELAGRWWLRRFGAYYVWPPGLKLHLRPDPAVFPELERWARIEINADGERGAPVPRSRRGLYRVLVAGGSPVECLLLDQPTSWPGALQRLLEAPGPRRRLAATRVHVGNVGLSGVTAQSLNVILKRILPRYCHLDLIVIMVGGNDVFGWLTKGAPRFFEPPAISTGELFRSNPEGPFGWSPRRLAMIRLLQRFRMRWWRPVKVREGAGKWVGQARAMRARAKEIRTAVPEPTAMLRLFEDQLRELLGNAKRHADRVLVVRQPWFETDYTPEDLAHLWHGAVGDPLRGEVSIYYSAEILCRLMALVSARAADVADDLGVEHLDLGLSLERSLNPFYDFVHFTPAGAAVVAEAVAAAILLRPVSVRNAVDLSARAPRAPVSS